MVKKPRQYFCAFGVLLGANSCSNLFSNYQDTYPQTSEHRNIFNHLSLRKESKLEYGSKNVINYLLMIMY